MKESTPETQVEDPIDPREVLREEFRSGLQPAIEELFQIGDQVDREISQVQNLSVEAKKKVEKFAKKIEKYLRHLFTSTNFILATIAAYEATGAMIRNDDSVSIIQNGSEVIYSHSDSNTTHYLNYLAGKDTLSEEEVGMIFKSDFKDRIRDDKIPIPHNFGKMTIDQIIDFISNQKLSPGIKENELGIFKKFPRFFSYNPDIYSALWTMEREVGNPKIRISQINPDGTDRIGSYHAFTNTITVWVPIVASTFDDFHSPSVRFDDDSLGYSLLGEMAHAKQSNIDLTDTPGRNIKDLMNTVGRAVKNKISLDSAQQYEYSRPGSIEYDAHKIIEPQLKKRFFALIDSLKKKLR